MHPTEILSSIQFELQSKANPAYRDHVAKLFDLNVDTYLGVKIPEVRKISTRYNKHVKSLDVSLFWDLCDIMLDKEIYEMKICTFQWVKTNKRVMQEPDLSKFEDWLEAYTSDWADCDDICSNVFGEYFLKFPDTTLKVLEWIDSDNLWKRRAAAVSLIKPLKKGRDLYLAKKICELLIEDDEDLVQKGYGWMLKVASQIWPDDIYAFVTQKADIMPRTAYRYALEKYPKPLRDKAMRL